MSKLLTEETKSSETSSKLNIDELTPREIVAELDKYIIGQVKAKRSVAIAIRNRIRRRKVEKEFREEIYPKNIIMIGPTGCGKTEIARRLARLARTPFVKVEATKYTEVGYVGRDVESMIRDLISTSINLVEKEFREKVKTQAEKKTRERLLNLLLPVNNNESKKSKNDNPFASITDTPNFELSAMGKQVQAKLKEKQTSKQNSNDKQEKTERAREFVAKKLDNLELEEREVEIEVTAPAIPMIQVTTGGPNLEDLDMHVQNMLGDLLPKKAKYRRVTIAEARRILMEEEVNRLVDSHKVKEEAIHRTEQMGIVFIDEVDKICGKSFRGSSGADISREGVQRDLLPIVEGATVNTRYGPIKTDHILFIAAGAFHTSSPSDLIPELQGRFPIRVELEKLTESDFCKILTGPRNSLVRQAKELLATEEVNLNFTEDGIQALASFAFEVNEKTENIGARRLHTLLEHLLDDISFEAPDLPANKKQITIDKGFVTKSLADVVQDKDLSRYIL